MMYVRLLALLLLMGSTQGLYEYTAACIPQVYDTQPFACFLTIDCNTTTSVEISTVNETTSFTLSAGTLYRQEFENFNPIQDVENKAIKILSDEAVQVLVYRDSTWFNDVYMIQNIDKSSTSFFTTAYVSNNPCSSSRNKQFYLVASHYNDTIVNVIQQDGTTFDVQLPAFGTFLQTTQDSNNHLAIGTMITSSTPVSVVSGNLCTYNRGGAATGASTMLPVGLLGHEYIVPVIISSNNNPAGFSVSVVATEDDTIVESDGEVRELDQGQTAILEYHSFNRPIFVNCSNNCLVAQYSKSVPPVYGMFMTNVLSEQQFYTSAYFFTLEVHPPTYLSLVVKGEAAGNDLYLNGESLGHLTWTPITGYSTAALEVPQGAHELESVNGRPFAVYIYGHGSGSDSGSGYALLHVQSTITTPPPTTTTTPRPTVNGTFPQHTVRVNGTAFSTDEQDISSSCAVTHLTNLDAKTQGMVVEVNRNIGESICMVAQDILVVTGKAAVFLQGNKMSLTVDHTLRVQGHHVMEDVESCAAEIAEYLNDHSNWQQPIFPDVAGCSRIQLDPPYFNTSGTFWNCDNQLDEGDSLNYLSYQSKVSEILSTGDGSELDAGCTLAYSDEAATKTSSMMTEISGALAVSGCQDVVTSATYAESFIGGGSQAFFLASFYYIPSPSASFAEFVACMQQVHEFSLQHENWSPGSQPGAPFLPVPPGCPPLQHDGPILDDEGHRWTCV